MTTAKLIAWVLEPEAWVRNVARMTSSLIMAAALAYSQDSPEGSRKVSFPLTGQDILRALIRLGSQERIPLGIVLDTSGDLCQEHINLSVANGTVDELLNRILSGSSHTWLIKDGVIGVRPRLVSKTANQVLNVNFDEYNSGIKTTAQGLGIVLAGQILARLGLTQGYAGTITSAIEADEIPPFRLHNVTVEQIANHIVTLQNRGAWILYPPGRTMKEKAEDAHLRIYGYKDDLRALEAESCPAP
jgi:hypothetical protein